MGRRRKGLPISGWLILDKDIDMTSTQAVNKTRWLLNAQKAGHAGTLDPLATGILPIAFGEGTKTIPYVQDSEKTYQFTVSWGEARTTDDLEGDVTDTSDKRPSDDEINAILPRFVGEIEQTPPKFSAIKINGERAYDLARAGKDVEMKSRIVNVYEIELLENTPEWAKFEVVCGKGTYMRALGRDIALALGTFGHISELRRLAVAGFSEKNAISLDAFEKMVQSAPPEDCLLPVEAALDDIPALALTQAEANRLANGQSVALFSRQDKNRLIEAGLIGDNDYDGPILARTTQKPIALVELDGAEVKPVRVLNL